MKPDFWNSIKQNIAIIVITAMLSVVPFYFQTTAQIAQNEQTDKDQQMQLDATSAKVQHQEIHDAVGDAKMEQMQQSLDRIEKKVDRLIDERN